MEEVWGEDWSALYPTENSPYKHPIIFDIFEGVDDAIWVRGSAKGILLWITQLVKRQAYEDSGAGFDSDFSGYTVDMEALDWGIPLDGIYPMMFSDNLSDYWPDVRIMERASVIGEPPKP